MLQPRGVPAVRLPGKGQGRRREKGEIMSDRKRREETPRTLRELGVPDELTKDLEAAFKAMGKTTGDRIVGFTFVTPEGARHRLRLEREPSDPAGDRAA